MSDILFGNLSLDNKSYPFVMENQAVYIIGQYYNNWIKSEENIQRLNSNEIRGITSRNELIIFQYCTFIEYDLIYQQICFTVSSYIISKDYPDTNSSITFNKINFYSKALNVFYSTKYATEPTNNPMETKFKSYDDSKQEFNISIQKEKIKCSLNFNYKKVHKRESSIINKCIVYFSFEFEEEKSLDTLKQYYFYLYDFLVFLNYSKNISFNEIQIESSYCDESYKSRKSNLYVFNKFSTYNITANNSIIFEDINKQKISKLFENIASKRLNSYNNTYYIPEKRNSFMNVKIDHISWLACALSFEGLFNEYYKDYKLKQNPNFASAKSYILELLEKNKHGNELTNSKQKDYFSSFKKNIEKTDCILEEKFNTVKNIYEKTLLLPILTLHENSIEQYLKNKGNGENIGKRYSKTRNSIAHGNIFYLEEIDKILFYLLRHMIYILILKDADIPDDNIKEILFKLFN